MSSQPKKITRGRQKIEMKMMENESNRQVTFSKRRTGLFKKASELCTLCDVNVVLIIFSPGNKVYSFGHPSVETVLDKFLGRNRRRPPQGRSTTGMTKLLIEARRVENIKQLSAQITEVSDQLDEAKKHGQQLDRLRTARRTVCWWEAPVEELAEPQILELSSALHSLLKKLKVKVAQANEKEKQNLEASKNSTAVPAEPARAGGSTVTDDGNNNGLPSYPDFAGVINFGPFGPNVAGAGSGGFFPTAVDGGAVAGPSSGDGWIMQQELSGRFMAQYGGGCGGADQFNMNMMMNGAVPAPAPMFPAGVNGGVQSDEEFAAYQQNMIDGYVDYYGGQEEADHGHVYGGGRQRLAGPDFSGDDNPFGHGFF